VTCAIQIVIVVCSSSRQIYSGWGCSAASSLSRTIITIVTYEKCRNQL